VVFAEGRIDAPEGAHASALGENDARSKLYILWLDIGSAFRKKKLAKRIRFINALAATRRRRGVPHLDAALPEAGCEVDHGSPNLGCRPQYKKTTDQCPSAHSLPSFFSCNQKQPLSVHGLRFG
jgi:hypothetical protein